MAGVFELFTDLHSHIRFRLLAPDGTELAVSQAYPDKRAAAAGITDVRECAGTGLIQDHTALPPHKTPWEVDEFLPGAAIDRAGKLGKDGSGPSADKSRSRQRRAIT